MNKNPGRYIDINYKLYPENFPLSVWQYYRFLVHLGNIPEAKAKKIVNKEYRKQFPDFKGDIIK